MDECRSLSWTNLDGSQKGPVNICHDLRWMQDKQPCQDHRQEAALAFPPKNGRSSPMPQACGLNCEQLGSATCLNQDQVVLDHICKTPLDHAGLSGRGGGGGEGGSEVMQRHCCCLPGQDGSADNYPRRCTSRESARSCHLMAKGFFILSNAALNYHCNRLQPWSH